MGWDDDKRERRFRTVPISDTRILYTVNKYTETLLESAEKGICPGCGPTLEDISIAPTDLEILYKYCTCCGWMVWILYTEGERLESQFSSMPPDLDGKIRFTCGIDHPEHRDNWPQPERDENQPDPFTSEEIMQEVLRQDGRHAYLTTPEERCGNCGNWGSHKIAEDRPNFFGHPYTAAICCNCFEKLFGPKSHQYEKVTEPVSIGDN